MSGACTTASVPTAGAASTTGCGFNQRFCSGFDSLGLEFDSFSLNLNLSRLFLLGLKGLGGDGDLPERIGLGDDAGDGFGDRLQVGLHCFVRLDLAATGAARTAVGLLEAFRNELGHVGHVLGALQQVGFRLGGFSLGRSGFDLHERLFGGFNGLMNGLAAARLGLDVVGGLGLGRRLDLNEFRGADVHACEEILCGLEVFGGPGLDLSFRLGLRLFLGLHFVRSLDGSFGSGSAARFGGAFGQSRLRPCRCDGGGADDGGGFRPELRRRLPRLRDERLQLRRPSVPWSPLRRASRQRGRP